MEYGHNCHNHCTCQDLADFASTRGSQELMWTHTHMANTVGCTATCHFLEKPMKHTQHYYTPEWSYFPRNGIVAPALPLGFLCRDGTTTSPFGFHYQELHFSVCLYPTSLVCLGLPMYAYSSIFTHMSSALVRHAHKIHDTGSKK
jgi:hypothetical protein